MAKVLVVDNDTNLHLLLHVLLTRAGYAVDFAADGPTGLQKMRDLLYDAILLDLLLPAVSGLDLLEQIHREQPEILPQVIVLSGATPLKVEKARTYPVHAVVRKPFDIHELLATVQACSGRLHPTQVARNVQGY